MAFGVSATTAAIAGATLVSGYMASNAAKDAANTQADAANNATAMQQGMFNTTQSNLQPYMQGGSSALSTLQDKIKSGQLGGQFTMADYLANKDPGYDFQFQQGEQALRNGLSAGDGALSGSALKGLINFGQGMAATGYQSAYQRWLASQSNTYSQLAGLASLGENAGANVGNAGVGYSNGMANTITGAGNAQAAGTIGSANAITGAVNNGMGYYQLSQLLPKTYSGFNGNQYTGYTNVDPSAVGPAAM